VYHVDMVIVGKQVRKILGLAAIVGIVAVSTIAGILIKDRNDSGAKSAQAYNNSGNGSENEIPSAPDIKIDHRKTICKDVFEEDEQDAILKGYSEKDVVDCSFVGCGGLF